MLEVLKQLSIDDVLDLARFINEEDGSYYDTYVVTTSTKKYIVKKSNINELTNYLYLLRNLKPNIPKLYKSTEYNDEIYILFSYFDGHNIRKCNRDDLIKALDALICIQDKYWEKVELNESIYYKYKDTLKSRIERGKYIKDPLFAKYYEEFLNIYQNVNKTLCHDDLLPFNVLVNDTQAYLIDWEYASIMPYPTSLARLLAHFEENEDAFFYMKESDKEFAINYYYDNFIKHKNIPYDKYIETMNYFIFYEYMEWIMLGEKNNDKELPRYKEYYQKALKHIEEKLNK